MPTKKDHVAIARRAIASVQEKYNPENDVIMAPGSPTVTWADEQLACAVDHLSVEVERLSSIIEGLQLLLERTQR